MVDSGEGESRKRHSSQEGDRGNEKGFGLKQFNIGEKHYKGICVISINLKGYFHP